MLDFGMTKESDSGLVALAPDGSTGKVEGIVVLEYRVGLLGKSLKVGLKDIEKKERIDRQSKKKKEGHEHMICEKKTLAEWFAWYQIHTCITVYTSSLELNHSYRREAFFC